MVANKMFEVEVQCGKKIGLPKVYPKGSIGYLFVSTGPIKMVLRQIISFQYELGLRINCVSRF